MLVLTQMEYVSQHKLLAGIQREVQDLMRLMISGWGSFLI